MQVLTTAYPLPTALLDGSRLHASDRHGCMQVITTAPPSSQGPFTTITKVYHWYRMVSELLGMIDLRTAQRVSDELLAAHSVRHIAKVDDDTFLNLPVCEALR